VHSAALPQPDAIERNASAEGGRPSGSEIWQKHDVQRIAVAFLTTEENMTQSPDRSRQFTIAQRLVGERFEFLPVPSQRSAQFTQKACT
jgi:hypothetical protein